MIRRYFLTLLAGMPFAKAAKKPNKEELLASMEQALPAYKDYKYFIKSRTFEELS